jgi:hypothetical protein
VRRFAGSTGSRGRGKVTRRTDGVGTPDGHYLPTESADATLTRHTRTQAAYALYWRHSNDRPSTSP